MNLGLAQRAGVILFCIMLPHARRTFIISWTVGALIVLGCQIVALVTPPATPGSHTVVLIGPTAVVFSALAVSPLILWLFIRIGGKTEATFRGFNRLGVAAAGFLGSFLTIFAVTIAVNLLIANIAQFSN